MASIQFTRAVEIRHEVDVFVAGGGPAGIAAAVTAARQGRRVFVVDAQNCFGGIGTAGLLQIFMTFTDGENFLAGGIGREIFDRLGQAKGFGDFWREGDWHDVLCKGEVLKRVYDDLLAGSGAAFSLCTQCIGIQARKDRIETAVCWGKSGLFAVKAKMYVDGTGDGDLCAWAGAPYEKGNAEGHMQPGTLCSLWADIDWAAAYAAGHGPWQQDGPLQQAFRDSVFTVPDPHLPGMVPVGKHTGMGNVGHAFGVDGTDERSITQALLEQRKRILEYERYYKEYLKGYENMELTATAAMMGIRETRRVTGDYVLNVADYRNRAVFDDEIGRYSFKLDLHPAQPGPLGDLQEYKKGDSYGIPYRCLTPKGLSNVLVAGRCISADRPMQGSTRVMPGCFITGQAAGMAAAMAAETSRTTREISVHELQTRLRKMGAFLPNLR